MSWQANPIIDVLRNDAEEAIKAAKIGGVSDDDVAEHVLDQFNAAKTAVIGVVKSGVVGDELAKLRISMSGHANPGHKPTDGWANDSVSFTISQTSRAEPADATTGISDKPISGEGELKSELEDGVAVDNTAAGAAQADSLVSDTSTQQKAALDQMDAAEAQRTGNDAPTT